MTPAVLFAALLLQAPAKAVVAVPPAVAGPPAGPDLPAEAQPRLELTVRPERAHVGEVVEWRLNVRRRSADRVTLPSGTAFGPFEVRRWRALGEERDGAHVVTRFGADLISFELGDLTVPPVRLEVLTEDRRVGEAHTPSARVRIDSIFGNEPHPNLREMRGPVPVWRRDWTLAYVGVAIGIIGLGVLLTLLVQRWLRGRKRRPAAIVVPDRPAWDLAFEKLEALRLSDLVGRSEFKEFYDRTSDVVREYFGRLYGFDGLDQTTEETVVRLRQAPLRGMPFAELLNFFSDCDLVKFAKFRPSADECRAVLEEAVRIVRVTMPFAAPLEPGPARPNSGPPMAGLGAGAAGAP